ncbi:hypothetical protein [Burkholderia plantarii]|uniref:Uncharacterized protein n=1 Tax=Burkholderia plantarii TaxID=41899 RepID=A0A0B6RV45_BURPL|nr:hypothetical protein [Burkholderia plantarii]AJK46049.1 hypothetical protein BGL_1c15330 [Burkholderia plantarii]ALK30316.1 hypothetical protein bpln_1g15050 [Burkholderia plantarii]GLZ18426.1 hypothetical protein Bpla01_19560 [Burkholderia plantarii]
MFFRPGTVRIPFAFRGRARERLRVMQRIGLDPARDLHARAALEAYADACAAEMPWLAEWLREVLGSPAPALTRCAPTVLRVFDLAQAWAAGQPDYARGAWEHVRGQLLAALAGARDAPAGDGWPGHGSPRPAPGGNESGERDTDTGTTVLAPSVRRR